MSGITTLGIRQNNLDFTQNETPTSGYHRKDQEYSFLSPQYFTYRNCGNDCVRFAEVEIDGKKTLSMLVEKEDEPDTYVLYKGPLSLEEILLAGPFYFSYLKEILQHPSNAAFDKKSFLEKLFRKDLSHHVFDLKNRDFTGFQWVLKLAETLGVQLDLHSHRKPDTGKTLLREFILDEEKVELVLKLDPQAISHVGASTHSFYAKALLSLEEKSAKVFLKAMHTQGIALSEEDRWLQMAYTNDLSFQDTDFTSLTPKLKTTIYRIANLYAQVEFVSRLNSLGMLQETFLTDPGFILGPNMDIVTVKEKVLSYFQELRRKGRLLTESEYYKKYPLGTEAAQSFPNSRYRKETNGFVDKQQNFGLLLGTDYIQNTIDSLGLQYPKTPFTIAVVPDEQLQFSVHTFTLAKFCAFSTDAFRIKAKYISYERQYAPNPQQQKELVGAVEGTGYDDLHDGNILLTEKGAYFVDTDLNNFKSLRPIIYEKLLSRFPINDEALRSYLTEQWHHRMRETQFPNTERIKMLKNAGLLPMSFSKENSVSFSLKDLLEIPIE